MSISKKIFLIFLRYYKGRISLARYLGVKVGKNCRIYIDDFGSEPFLIEIGNNVTITSGCKLLTHDGSTWLIRDDKGRRYLYKKITIGNNVFIGVNSILMPGVQIGNNVIIAAGSIVTKSIPDGVIVAGNPVKIIGNYYQYEQNALQNLYSDIDFIPKENYVQRVSRFLNHEPKPLLKQN